MRRFFSRIPLNYKTVYIKHHGMPHFATTELYVLEPDFPMFVCLEKTGPAGSKKIQNP